MAVKCFKAVANKSAKERAYDFGVWIIGQVAGKEEHQVYCEQMLGIKCVKFLTGTQNVSGGYVIPEQFIDDIISLKETYGVCSRRARVVPMKSDVASRPVRTGGVTMGFIGEAGTIGESDMTFGNAKLAAKKIGAVITINDELDADSIIDLGETVAQEIAVGAAYQEDICLFLGDGTSTYGGINGICNRLLGLSATIANIAGLVVGSSHVYSGLVLSDFQSVAGILPEYASVGAAWYCHREFYYTVMSAVASTAGNHIAAEYNNTIGTATPRFLGYPVEMTQVMPKAAANSQVCALLGDLNLGAMLGIRSISVAQNTSIKFASDQTMIRGLERFDINVHSVGNADATPANRVPGPIVGLITAAS
jgi:HK97 family phage major capsid protein